MLTPVNDLGWALYWPL